MVVAGGSELTCAAFTSAIVDPAASISGTQVVVTPPVVTLP